MNKDKLIEKLKKMKENAQRLVVKNPCDKLDEIQNDISNGYIAAIDEINDFIQPEPEEQKASDCECCHEFNEWLEILSNCEHPHVFYSKITIVGLIKGCEKGETNTRKFPLRYCPQCGRKVDGGKNEHR